MKRNHLPTLPQLDRPNTLIVIMHALWRWIANDMGHLRPFEVFVIIQIILGTQALIDYTKNSEPVLGLLATSFLFSTAMFFVYKIFIWILFENKEQLK